jgi:hypothetical protein
MASSRAGHAESGRGAERHRAMAQNRAQAARYEPVLKKKEDQRIAPM